MAEIVGAFAVSHTPVMVNFPNAIDAVDREAIYGSFQRVGEMIRACRPDALIVVSDDHLHNFFLDNFPAFCIGAGNTYPAPAEHWLKAKKHSLRGDTSLGAHLLGEALSAGFDPSFSMHLTLDHGVLTPLVLAGIAEEVAVVPLLINCVQPPMPTMRRCLEWGGMVRAAIESYQPGKRIALLATGGISHDVATPRMGYVNEAFDKEFLRLIAAADDEGLVKHCTDNVDKAGNGAEEIRNWLLVHGAAGSVPFEAHYYQAVPKWYTGIALGHWRLGDRSASAKAGATGRHNE